MPKAIQLPKFEKLSDVLVDHVNSTLTLIFETADENNKYFSISIGSDLAAQLIPTILENSPKSEIEPMSFTSKLSNIKTGIDENGIPLLGLFFPSAIPVSVCLTDETMALLKHAITDLELKVGADKNVTN